MRALLVTIVILVCAPHRACACDEDAARRAAASVSPLLIAGERPREQSSQWVAVNVSGPEVGPPSFGAFVRAGCTAVAIAYRWTIVRTDTTGNDVYYEPEHVGGVAVLELSGPRLVVRARGSIDGQLLESLELGPPSDEDGDGRHEITKARPHTRALGPLALEVRGRSVRPLSERDVSRPSSVARGSALTLELEPPGATALRVTAQVLAVSPPDAAGVVRVDLGHGRALRVRVPPPLALPLAVGDTVDVELTRRQPSVELPADVVVRASDGRVLLLYVASGATIAPFVASPGRRRGGVRVSAGNLGAELARGEWRELTTREGTYAIRASIEDRPGGPVRNYGAVRVR